MATNAEAIARALVEGGVEMAFGHPGGEVVVLLDACRRAGIRFFLVGHEASAAFMADVTGQITGRPGVCISTLGPGAMNLCLGVANAALDRSPVLAVTASISTTIQRHFSHQRLPLTQIFGTICKQSTLVDGKGTAELTSASLRLAATPTPGPVHLALPSNLAGEEALAGAPLSVAPPAPSEGPRLHEIAVALREAKRPLLLVGVGCQPRDVPALRQFVDRTQLPFTVTSKAKGMLPGDAPGFLGVVGGVALDAAIMETVEEADLLLGVGFDPVECDKAWYVQRSIANLSRAPTAEGDYRPIEHVGDISEALSVLGGNPPSRRWPDDLLVGARARVRPDPLPAESGLSPLGAIRSLREALPRDTILTCDVGSHKYFAGQFWESYEPQTFFVSNGLSGMGYGIPAAIAAKIHFPHRPVVALVGDGGLLMMLHNLTFIRQYQIPVVVICFVDNSLSLIRLSQQRRGLDSYGVDFPAPDFGRVAEAFGIAGRRARSVDDLTQSVQDTVRRGESILIHAPIDIREYEAYA